MTRRLMLRAAAAVLALLILALAGLLWWVSQRDTRAISAAIAKHSEQSIGRALNVDGPLRFGWSLAPTLQVDNLRLANASWGSAPDMLRVPHAQLQLALLPLLRGKIEIRSITLQQPQLLLEINAKGERNWDFMPSKQVSEAPSQPLEIDIAKLSLEGGQVDYRPAKGAAMQLQLKNLQLATKNTRMSLQAQLAGRQLDSPDTALVPLNIEGELPSLAGWRASSIPLPLRVSALLGKNTRMQLEGNVQGPAARGGSVNDSLILRFYLNAPEPRLLASDFAVQLPRLPALRLDGQLRLQSDSLKIEDLTAQLGNSQLLGAMQIALGSRALQAQIKASQIDLREIGAPLGSPESAPAPTAQRLFSDQRFALAGWREAKMNLELGVDKVILKDGRSLSGLQLTADLADGKLRLPRAQILLGKQRLRLSLNADFSKGNTLAVDTLLDGRALPLAEILALAGQDARQISAAPTDVDVHLSGAGSSVRSLMASLDGQVKLVAGAGRWDSSGLALGRELSLFATALSPVKLPDANKLECAVIRFPVRQGLAHIKNGIGIETGAIHLLGGGSINLRDETLDIGVRPSAANGAASELGQFAQLVRLKGTFSQPVVTADAASSAKAVLDLGLAAASAEIAQGGRRKGRDPSSDLLARLLSKQTTQSPCELALADQGEVPSNEKPSTQGIPAGINQAIDGLKSLFGK